VEATLPEEDNSITSFGPYRLFPSLRRLERSGHPVELGGRAFDVLCVLIAQAGEIVTTRELMSRVWGRILVGQGSLRFHINALRKALAQDGIDTPYIKNIARRGYAFVAPVRRYAVEQRAESTAEVVVRLVDLILARQLLMQMQRDRGAAPKGMSRSKPNPLSQFVDERSRPAPAPGS
jgi:DNA-binding winged helix-turn-helix (wHTH) protein